MALSKNQIKFICSLHQKKYRDENKLFIAEGEKIVNDLLKSSFIIKSIYATNFFLKSQLTTNSSQIIEVTQDELIRISTLTTPNQALAVAEIPQYEIDEKEIMDSLSLVLDEIQDPGNLGTIIRIADWFGIKNIICSENCVDVFNPKVVQATMGSICRVKIHYTDIKMFLENGKWKMPCLPEGRENGNSFKIYGALLNGKNIYEEKLSNKGLIILGNESKGLSKDLLPFITHKIKIPSFSNSLSKGEGRGEVESLNVAVAAAVICSEFNRGF